MKLNKDFTPELNEINTMLGSDFAIISRIKDNDYEVAYVASELPTVKQGDHFETKNTYCNEVVNTNDVVTYDQVGKIRAMVLHPIYTAMQLEAYIGVPLRYEGNVIGTLNFSGFMPKSTGFSEEEVSKVHALAAQIEGSIDQASL